MRTLLGILRDVAMWIVLLLTIVLATALVWPVFLFVNLREVLRRELMFFLAGGLLFADQFSKWLVVSHLARGESIPLFAGFHFTYVQNRGAAFGLFQNRIGLFVFVAVVSVAVIVYYSRCLAPDNRWVQAALAFLLAGAVGNMIDRVFFGYVIDFIDLRFWPVFNIADIVINVGVGMLLVEMFWEGQAEEEEERAGGA